MKVSLFSSKASVLSKVLIPGLTGLILIITKRGLQHLLSEIQQIQSNNEPDFSSHLPRSESLWLLKSLSETLESMGETLLQSYNNYLAFLFMMLLVHVIIHGSSKMRNLFHREKKQNPSIFAKNPCDVRGHLLIPLLKSLLVYSVIYGFYQIIWIYFLGGVSLSVLAESPFPIMSSRILEEQLQLFSSKEVEWKKPSLSIGKVLSKLDISTSSIKLSKDRKTAFGITLKPSALLKIIDISDPEDPLILSTLSISECSYSLMLKSLMISADETKLFVTDTEYLEIIDISDLKAPILIGKVRDSSFAKPTDDYRIYGICKSNLVISKDAKFLFAAGVGLQIFDISSLTSPNLIKSVHSQIDTKSRLSPASIALSQDGKILYYTDGSFWVYNVEDPRNMKVLNSFNTTYPISSMMLSKDDKTAFVLSLNGNSKVSLQKLKISDVNFIIEEESEAIEFDQVSPSPPLFLEQSPRNIFLFILVMPFNYHSWHKLLVFDTHSEQLLTNENLFVKDALSVFATEDYEKVLVGSGDQLAIVELYLDYPNKHAFTESSNIIQTFETNVTADFLEFYVAPENVLYTLIADSKSGKALFGIHKISNQQEFVNISIYDTQEEIRQMVISKDNKTAFWVSKGSIIITDISNPGNIRRLGTYLEEEAKISIRDFILSQDGKTGYLTSSDFRSQYLTILDFSDPKKPTKKGAVDLKDTIIFLKPILSKDEQTIFIMSQNLSVYNVSGASSPVLITTLPSILEKTWYKAFPEMLLSPDGNTLFLKDPFVANFVTVRMIDVSDIASPKLRSDFRFPMSKFEYSQRMKISPDSKTFYYGRDYSLMAVDVSNVNSPRYLGAIKILSNTSGDYIKDFRVSSDGRNAFVSTSKSKFHVIGLEPMYSTFLMQDVFLLGERYEIDLQVLKMNSLMNYDKLDQDYKLIKFALVEPKSIQNSNFEDVVLKMLPSWMSIDLRSQTLTVEARRKSDIGMYKVYLGYSGQLPEDLFEGDGGATAKNNSADLFATLLTLGYIDNERFVTDSFGKFENFILPSQYLSSKEEIYKILKWFSFGTFNEISVVQSLNVTVLEESKKLQVSTTSLTNIKVEINLLEGEETLSGAKFLFRNYGSLVPVITGYKSRLILEGSLKDVNLALKEVVIHTAMSCDGEIIIDDKLNPIMIKPLKNISQYFNHNKPPRRNESFPLTIQKQIDRELVYTGEHFQIKLNPLAFSDDYTLIENLHYQLVFMKDKNETTALPSWVSFSDMTLAGTAPEEIWGRDFEFKLVVKNEFQEFKEPLKIHVRISAGFVLKLLIKYSPYILSIVGLLISANRIFNIIFKGTYKHPKEFSIKVGEEVTSEVIFPVSFIQEERQEAKRILKLLERKSELLAYFMREGEGRKVDKLRVLEVIKESINELVPEEKAKFYLYSEGGPYYLLVNQIIINTLTMSQLNSSDEKETRGYYEKIKKQWPELVEWDLVNSCFKINKESKKFKDIEEETTLVNDEESSNLSEMLVKKSNVNLDLLKDAILTYAFECQNIDILPVFIEIKVKEKIKANFLKRFLKRDLKEFPFSERGKIGYGIGYHKKYNTLFFNGVVDADFKYKTMVVQITTRDEKILKELWISGEVQSNENDQNEIEAQGKGYAIF